MKPTPRVVLGVLPVVAALIWAFCPPSPARVEATFARQIYPFWTRTIVPLTDSLPVPVGLVLLVFLSVGLICVWVRRWRKDRARGVRLRRLVATSALSLGLTAVTLYVIFLAVWGAAYRRPALESRLGVDDPPMENVEFAAFADRVLKTVTANYQPPEERQFDAAVAAMRSSLQEFTRAWNLGDTELPSRAKRLPAGWLLTFGSAGLCLPFTLEAYVDGALPDVAYLAVALHELAHVAGLARESDADLAAYVVGLSSENRYVRYALSLRLLRGVSAALDPVDRESLRDKLPEGVQQDLRDIRQALLRHDFPMLSAIQRRIYDTYLRSQGVDDGLKNYSKALRLIADAVDRGLVNLEK